jgi:hypothetical protein
MKARAQACHEKNTGIDQCLHAVAILSSLKAHGKTEGTATQGRRVQTLNHHSVGSGTGPCVLLLPTVFPVFHQFILILFQDINIILLVACMVRVTFCGLFSTSETPANPPAHAFFASAKWGRRLPQATELERCKPIGLGRTRVRKPTPDARSGDLPTFSGDRP